MKVIKKKNGKELIFDEDNKKYSVVDGGNITIVSSKDAGLKMLGEQMTIKERLDMLAEFGFGGFKKLTKQDPRSKTVSKTINVMDVPSQLSVKKGDLLIDEKNKVYAVTTESLQESVDLICPNCGYNLGKDTENPKKAYCGNCGKSFKNPRGESIGEQMTIKERVNNLMEAKEAFTEQDMKKLLQDLKSKLRAPYVEGHVSTLGGKDRASTMLTISKTRKNDWPNHILENSNYGKFHIGNNGVIEMISGSMKPWMRKTRFKDLNGAISKLNNYLSTVKENIGDNMSIKERLKILTSGNKGLKVIQHADLDDLNESFKEASFAQLMGNPKFKKVIENIEDIGDNKEPRMLAIKKKLMQQLKKDFDYKYVESI